MVPALPRAAIGPTVENGYRRGTRWFADEALGVLLEGCNQDALPIVEDTGGESLVDHVRRQHCDAAVLMFEVVPAEEALAMDAGVFQRVKAVRELGVPGPGIPWS